MYEMYYEYGEAVRRMPAHRILAVNRGEREEVLRVSIDVEEEEILRRILERFPHPGQRHLKEAVEDGYKRLLAPSVEREIRGMMTEKAEEQAIRIFAENLRNLLLTPPITGKRVLGVDPAYRTGCKLAVVDDTGKLLHTDVIFPTPPENRVDEAKRVTRGHHRGVRHRSDRHRQRHRLAGDRGLCGGADSGAGQGLLLCHRQ